MCDLNDKGKVVNEHSFGEPILCTAAISDGAIYVRSDKTLWKIADAGHTGGLDAHPVAYERRVVGFFDRALLPRK